ncbi:hypothetical protein MEI_00055 [Bartonella vinsonii subsp. arupensis Pm136co]|uniref:Uncharacterized protein n=1 Tax=Bartonella vinsonii subsp. arupensis Pm136co TaxID=1094561 RepID=A0ABN0GRG8_BARVI|nr:hypothetical protein [Bartonella vinsonii]EJF98888.1 hypothetical protein MEI_00055 [Bartonella vinsonii subsp. arupensis Pm136co]
MVVIVEAEDGFRGQWRGAYCILQQPLEHGFHRGCCLDFDKNP